MQTCFTHTNQKSACTSHNLKLRMHTYITIKIFILKKQNFSVYKHKISIKYSTWRGDRLIENIM